MSFEFHPHLTSQLVILDLYSEVLSDVSQKKHLCVSIVQCSRAPSQLCLLNFPDNDFPKLSKFVPSNMGTFVFSVTNVLGCLDEVPGEDADELEVSSVYWFKEELLNVRPR